MTKSLIENHDHHNMIICSEMGFLGLSILMISSKILITRVVVGLAVVVSGSICYQSVILTYLLNQNKLTDVSVVLLFVILGFFIFC